MTAQQYKSKRNNPRHQKKKGFGSCFSKTLLVLLIFFVLGSIIIVLCTTLLSDTQQKFEKLQYPQKYSEFVSECSKKYDVEESLIYAVIRTESSFNSDAKSGVGAMGLMQIMPDTFTWLLEKQDKTDKYTVNDLYEPEVNIEFGTYYLSILLDHYTSTTCAIAAYNAGFVVDHWLEDPQYSKDGVNLDYIPYDETANYVNKVETSQKKYEEIYCMSNP